MKLPKKISHPKGEQNPPTKKNDYESYCTNNTDSLLLETFGGKVHVEWDPDSSVTPLGQLAFFIEFLKIGDLLEPWIKDCPLSYMSHNAPTKRDVLGTLLLSILSGHHRYAHVTGIRNDGVNPGLLGMNKLVSEDSLRCRATITVAG